MYCCAQLYKGCGASNSGPYAFKASALPTKPLRTASTVNTRWVQHPFSPGAQRGELTHPLFRIATAPHPTIALVLLTVLCDSAGLHSTILHPPLPMFATLSCGPVRSGPWVQRPREAERGTRHLHSTSRGCSDLTCNSSDKSLSAMPMAESVATLFVLISSEQISSSQRLAGSYRFLINVGTDFSRLGPGWGMGLGRKCRTGRRERCWPEADEENAGRITSGL